MRGYVVNSLKSLYGITRYCSTTCSSEMDTQTKKKALVLLAQGAEEMEFVISVDILRRCGVGVTIAGVGGKDNVKCVQGVVIVPETSLCDAISNGPYDAVILPGGMGGTKILSDSCEVNQVLKEQESSGRIIAAICAAPLALKAHKIAFCKSLTSYPSVKKELECDYVYCEKNVVVADNLITSRGPGTAFAFALAIGEKLVGKETADKVAEEMMI